MIFNDINSKIMSLSEENVGADEDTSYVTIDQTDTDKEDAEMTQTISTCESEGVFFFLISTE